MGDRKRRLSRAIDALALRVEHGALLAATDPAALLESAGDRIASLESRLAEVERERDEARQRATTAEARVREVEEALRGLLLSRDASWTGGHDWQDAVDHAVDLLPPTAPAALRRTSRRRGG